MKKAKRIICTYWKWIYSKNPEYPLVIKTPVGYETYNANGKILNSNLMWPISDENLDMWKKLTKKQFDAELIKLRS